MMEMKKIKYHLAGKRSETKIISKCTSVYLGARNGGLSRYILEPIAFVVGVLDIGHTSVVG